MRLQPFLPPRPCHCLLRLVLAGCLLLLLGRAGMARQEVAIDIPQYLAKAKQAEQQEQFREASWFLNQVAMKHWEAERYQDAIRLFEQSLELNRKVDNQQGILGIYSNLAMIYADMREYREARRYFEYTLEGRKKGRDKVSIISGHINLSVVLNNLKEYDESAKHLLEALRLAREMNDPQQMRSCYGMLSETYEKAGNVEESLRYFELYRTFHELVQREVVREYRETAVEAELRAKLLEAEKQQQDMELAFKERELRRREQELAAVSQVLSEFDSSNRSLLENASKSVILKRLLTAENERIGQALEAQRLRLERSRWITAGLAVGLLAMAALAWLIYRNGRERKRMNKALKEALDESEHHKAEAFAAYDHLKNAQTQLVHQEKMASLGQLTAGIAHEINNPLNFVYAGVDVLALSREVYEEALQAYQALHGLPPEALPEALEAVRTQCDDAGLEEARQDMSDMLVSVKEGSTRVMEIVRSLQYFSRQRHTVATKADLNQCVDSTLMLLSNKIDGGTVVRKHYAPAPKAECFPSQVNQVLMNLLVNALDAMEERKVRELDIFTEEDGDMVRVRIQDTGGGIPKAHLDKIFDPFFTTKEIGKGTGLGLSISYGIVQDHRGTLQVESQEGVGSTFTLSLPKEWAEPVA